MEVVLMKCSSELSCSHCISITFYNSSTLHNGTFDSNSETMKMKVGIHSYACTNIQLTSITVFNSSGAVGVALFDSMGTIDVINSIFSHNTFSGSGNGGGGLYIESSAYLFGDGYCQTNVSETTRKCVILQHLRYWKRRKIWRGSSCSTTRSGRPL